MEATRWIGCRALFISWLMLLIVGTCTGQFQQNQFGQRGQARFQQQQQQSNNPFFQQQNYQQVVQQQQQQQPQEQFHQQFDNRQSRFQQHHRSLAQQANLIQEPERSINSGASCPELNGRFPVASQCDAYIECVEGVGEQKLCPEGLLFNPEARFNYPCGYPTDVQCLSRSALQPAQPTEECPHQYGFFKIGDRQNCGKFMNCVEGRSFVLDCPEGLAYNPDSYRCDWPDQVADCDAEAYLGFTCPTFGQNTFLNSEARLYKSPNDCQHYYVCVDNRPRLHNCGEGRAFNELIGACDGAENVTGCAPQRSSNQNFQSAELNQPKQNLRSFNQQQNSFNQQQNSRNNQQQNSFVAQRQNPFLQQQNSYNQQQQQQNVASFGQQQNLRGQQNYRNNQQSNQFTSQRFSSF